jgi:hypothetical protein
MRGGCPVCTVVTRIQVIDLKRDVQHIPDYTDTAYMDGMANFRIISLLLRRVQKPTLFHSVTTIFHVPGTVFTLRGIQQR